MKLSHAVSRLVALVLLSGLGGCLERRVSITSDPTGAGVFINDVELGRTPLEAEFTYYGEYDVRVEKTGFEPLRTTATATAPIYEYPPFDFVATAIPIDIDTVVPWHFVLQPTLETTQSPEEFERGIMERAGALRARIEPGAGTETPATAAPNPAPSSPDGRK